MGDLLGKYRKEIVEKKGLPKKIKTKEDARAWLRAKGYIKDISSEELDRRIREKVPGTYIRNGITIHIGGTNPFEPDDI